MEKRKWWWMSPMQIQNKQWKLNWILKLENNPLWLDALTYSPSGMAALPQGPMWRPHSHGSAGSSSPYGSAGQRNPQASLGGSLACQSGGGSPTLWNWGDSLMTSELPLVSFFLFSKNSALLQPNSSVIQCCGIPEVWKLSLLCIPSVFSLI